MCKFGKEVPGHDISLRRIRTYAQDLLAKGGGIFGDEVLLATRSRVKQRARQPGKLLHLPDKPGRGRDQWEPNL